MRKTKQPTWGGKRAGAGRKKSDAKSINTITIYSVHITGKQAALLKKWGGGDLSAGLRWLVNTAQALIQLSPPSKTINQGAVN